MFTVGFELEFAYPSKRECLECWERYSRMSRL